MRRLEYLEKRQRGTAEFPMELYRLTPDSEQYIMQCHWHHEYEIISVRKGSLALILDEHRFTVSAGELVLLPEGTLHTGLPLECEYDCIVFSQDLFSDRFGSGGLRELLRRIPKNDRITSDESPEMHRLLSQLISALERLRGAESKEKRMAVETYSIGLLYQFFGVALLEERFSDRVVEGRRHTEQLKRVIGYIESNYREEITLADLAAAAGLSDKYLCRIFSQITGKSPMEYLNEYRVDRACMLLSDTDSQLLDVAYSCGFNDQSYFIKIFKRYKGVTPGKYRCETAR